MNKKYKNYKFLISTDKSKLDLGIIHNFLKNSYWARNIPLSIIKKSIRNSLCFGVYKDKKQIGFARVISDYATFAYVADVFILETHQGIGLSKWLMKSILSHPKLRDLRRWILVTKDAHGLYLKYGFKPLKAPERFMELHNPNVYMQ